MKYIHAIQINLGDLGIAQDTDIGLYNESGTNYLRWSEFPVVGDTSSWTTGLISIGATRISADLRRGGATASNTGYVVVIPNTSQLFQAYEDLDISITGKPILRYEFRGDDADADSTDKTLLSTMSVAESTWTEKEWTIHTRNGQKDALLTTIVNNGKVDSGVSGAGAANYPYANEDTNGSVVPVTIGKFLLDFDDENNIIKQSIAKFIRTNNKREDKQYSDYDLSAGTNNYDDTFSFPIYDHTTVRTYEFRLRDSATASQSFDSEDLENTFVCVVDGTGAGQIRKLTSITVTNGSQEAEFVVTDYFETELQDYTDEETVSWITFVKIYKQYDVDVWPCHSFRDWLTGAEETNTADLFTYEDDEFQLLFPYGFDFTADSDNNKLIINPNLFDGNDVDSQNSYVLLELSGAAEISDTTLYNWLGTADIEYAPDGEETAETAVSGADFYMYTGYPGLYSTNPVSSNPGYTFSNLSNMHDKDSTTYAHIDYTEIPNNSDGYLMAIGVKFDLPPIPQNFTFDALKVGIKLKEYETETTYGSQETYTTVLFVMRKFQYSRKLTEVLSQVSNGIAASSPAIDLEIDNMPDFYFDDEPTTNNENFFYKREWNDTVRKVSGINLEDTEGTVIFDTGITTKEEYESYIECGIIIVKLSKVNNSSASIKCQSDIYEACLVFEQTNDTKKDIYTPFYGRIFNDTWGGRVTAANHIDNCIDTLEHIKRLERYGDNEAGKEYSASALIKTTGEGSFDDAGLNNLRGYDSFSMQLHDETLISEVEKILCSDYSILSFYDNNGYACVKTFESESPAETISYSDTMGKIEVVPPSPDDVFCQPKIFYCFNNATEEYDKTMEVKNVHLDTYDADICTSGINSAEAEDIWDICRALYVKYGVINDPPTSWSELRTVTSEVVARDCLSAKLNIMSMARIRLRVNYEKGRLYTIFKHVNFTHPHITDGSTVECIIEEIRPDKNGNYVELTLLTDTIAPLIAFGAWQNTYDIGNPLYQDTYDNANDRYQGIT